MSCPASPPKKGEDNNPQTTVPVTALTIFYVLVAVVTLGFIACLRRPLNRWFNHHLLPDLDNRLVGPTLKTIAVAVAVVFWPLDLLIGVVLLVFVR